MANKDVKDSNKQTKDHDEYLPQVTLGFFTDTFFVFSFFSELNYFQVKQLFENLKSTDAGKKNLIGQFSNQSMKVSMF